MKLVLKTEKVVVCDDFLSSEDHNAIWAFVQNQTYSFPHQDNWAKVWRVTDGQPLAGTNYLHSKAPSSTPMDVFHRNLLHLADVHKDFVGTWNEIFMRAYLYSRRTKISWHSDGNHIAAIYYPHPYWGSTWGGELMVAETPEKPEKPLARRGHLDHRDEDEFLSFFGMGQYIVPKSNRLVMTACNVWHQVNRVDDDAGDHCRASLTAFFKQT